MIEITYDKNGMCFVKTALQNMKKIWKYRQFA